MAVEIACFAARVRDRMGPISIFKRPGLGALAGVDIGASAARSSAFPAGTKFVRLVASADCRIEFGEGTVDATADSEMFQTGEHVVAVDGATHLSVIQP
jgi:hypothetical protein